MKSVNLSKPFMISILIISFLASYIPGVSAEEPVETYSGSQYADAVLKNVSFSDIARLYGDSWPKATVYEMAALDIIKGYGDRTFGREEYVSKEQAIALLYRMAGREADAQKSGEELQKARSEDERLRDAVRVWSDGYLKLASTEGIITQEDFDDALSEDQSDVRFSRTSPATREQVAEWTARILKIEPVYGQQVIFNSYNDWRNADPLKVPYIEAVLKARIMNGMEGGYFYPAKFITRQEMAQVLKNAEEYAFPVLNLQKRFGIVETINAQSVQTTGRLTEMREHMLRMSDGTLHKMVTEFEIDAARRRRVESAPGRNVNGNREIVVYKDGNIGNSDLLNEGDNIEITLDENKTVKFVKVIDSDVKPAYVAAKVKSIDIAGSLITVEQFSYVIDPVFYDARDDAGGYITGDASRRVSYNVSTNVAVIIDKQPSSMDKLVPETYVILTTRSGIVTSIRTANLDIGMEKNVATGIVEENNPALGYISLYSEDGSNEPEKFRIYYYNTGNLEVLKDGKPVHIDGVKPGDTVFLRLGPDDSVREISAKNNYVCKYANVISKYSDRINVEYDDGSQQMLEIDDSLLIIKDRRIVGYGELKSGDRVKLILHEQQGSGGLKQLTIEHGGSYISNVYRARISYIDGVTGKVVWENVERLEGGKWIKEDNKGNYSIPLGDNCRIMYGGEPVDTGTINNNLKKCAAYIAAEKGYGGEEKAAFISLRNEADNELGPYEDRIAAVYEGTRDIGIRQNPDTFKYGEGTIIIKSGRLVSIAGVAQNDPVVLVASRNDRTGDLVADVINVPDRAIAGSLMIYRGRISNINDNTDFTVGSYATLDGLIWNTVNTPKTFKLSYDTRILGDDGAVSIRDFLTYGDNSYKDRSVYVVAKDAAPVLISTAPYGYVNIKGEVLSTDLAGGTGAGSGGANQFTLFRAKRYNNTTGQWADCADLTVSIPQNAIIIKDGNIASVSEIRKGRTVRILKSDSSLTEDGYIIFIER